MSIATINSVTYTFFGINTIVSGYNNSTAPSNWNLVIPSTVTYLGTTYNVVSIGNNAFKNCLTLTSVTIPSSVTSIGSYAFANSGLTSVTIPSSVTSIGAQAFISCASLTQIIVDQLNSNYSSLDGVLFNKLKTLLIQYPLGKKQPFDYYEIPSSVITIGSVSFTPYVDLSNIIIPNSVTTIQTTAFQYCDKITSITIPSSVTSIEFRAFNIGTLTSVTFLGNIPTIEHTNFINNNDTAYYIVTDTINSNPTTVNNNLTMFTNKIVVNPPPVITNIDVSEVNLLIYFTQPTNVSGPIITNYKYTLNGGGTYTTLNPATTTSPLLIPVAQGNFSINIIGIDNSSNIASATSNFYYVSLQTNPTITNFNVPSGKIYSEPPFSLTDPSSNSSGAFTFTSSDTSVATISGRTVTIVGAGSTTITATQSATTNYNSGTISASLTISIPNFPICFPAGTPVQTDQGQIAIEKINPSINTIRNKNIVAVTKTVTIEDKIVCIEKDSLGLNIPSQKTYISRNHELLYNKQMIKAKNLIGVVDGVYNKKYNGEILYNVLLDKHDKMVVNNLIVETLDPTNIVAQLYNSGYTEKEKQNIIVNLNQGANEYKKVFGRMR